MLRHTPLSLSCMEILGDRVLGCIYGLEGCVEYVLGFFEVVFDERI